jgi:hypothetical protein
MKREENKMAREITYNQDITYRIAELVRLAMPELDSRQEYQAEALAENECIEPAIGWWVDTFDVKYLLSLLVLNDSDFRSLVSDPGTLSKEKRLEMAAEIEGHFERCGHCARKRGYDIELDDSIKTICLENREFLLELLEEEVVEQEPAVTAALRAAGNDDSGWDDNPAEMVCAAG